MREARDLRELGINDIAWAYPRVLQAVTALLELNYVILGGDVYRDDGHELSFTYDSWYVKRRGTGDVPVEWDHFTRYAADRAISYIEKYHARNGDAFWYGLGPCSESLYTRLFPRS